MNFVPNQKPRTVDVTILRRQKLVRRIDQQIGFVRLMIEGHNPRGSWVWMDDSGIYFVPVKYGRHTLELKKGLFSVQCQDLNEVEHVFCVFRGMVLKGGYGRSPDPDVEGHPKEVWKGLNVKQ